MNGGTQRRQISIGALLELGCMGLHATMFGADVVPPVDATEAVILQHWHRWDLVHKPA